MILQTNRLLLRHLQPSDISLLYMRVFSHPKVMRYAFQSEVLTLERTEAFIEELFAKEGSTIGLASLFLRNYKECIGFAGLLPSRALGVEEYQLGFVLAEEVWQQGYATEIGQAQIELAASLGEKRVLALVDPDNVASKATIAKLGMRYYTTVDTEGRGMREVYGIDIHKLNSKERG